MALTFELVSPERKLASAEAESVTIPGMEGDLTAMAGHAPFLTTLRPGTVVVRGERSDETRWFVTGGFAEISRDTVTVLAERGIEAEKADAAFLDERIAEAEGALEEAPAERQRIARQRLDDFQSLRARL